MKMFRRLLAAAGLAGFVQAGPLAAEEPRDCMALRKEHGWTRAEFKVCKLEEMQKEIDALDAKFAQMREWLQARGLDLNDAGHIIDPKGRTLAVIEAQNTQLEEGNAQLEEGNAQLEEGNAALRAELLSLQIENQQLDAEYAQIIADFRAFLNENAN